MDLTEQKEFKLLIKRFVSDCNLPISVYDPKVFDYLVRLYEEDYHSLTKWNNLCKLIECEFDGNIHAFLEKYYEVRENVINNLKGALNMVEPDVIINIKNGIPKNRDKYTQETIGKSFISIDLTKANFQICQLFSNPKLVYGSFSNISEAYDKWISEYTDMDYIKESKYFRQVVFGNCNVKEQVRLMNYQMQVILSMFTNAFREDGFELFSLTTDELIFKFNPDGKSLNRISEGLTSLKEALWNFYTVDVKTELYTVDNLFVVEDGFNDGDRVFPFYVKKNMITLEEKLVKVPGVYFAQVYKIFKGMPVNDIDTCFYYEHRLANFSKKFVGISAAYVDMANLTLCLK